MKKRLVDADKLMERAKMNSVLFTVEHDHHDYGLTLGALNKIVKECELPSAQPELKRGEWEFYEDRSPVWDIAGEKTWARAYKCSECGFAHTVIEDFGRYSFCPNCGADMREDDHG